MAAATGLLLVVAAGVVFTIRAQSCTAAESCSSGPLLSPAPADMKTTAASQQRADLQHKDLQDDSEIASQIQLLKAPQPAPAPTPTPSPPPFRVVETSIFAPFESNGVGKYEDNVTLLLPESLPANVSVPLVVMLHGYCGGPWEMLAGGFSLQGAMNAQRPFIIAAPAGRVDSIGCRYWAAWGDWCGDCGSFNKSVLYQCQRFCNAAEDADTALEYIRALVRRIRCTYSVDPAQIFVFGHSNGAGMAYRAACDASDLFAAAASFAGAPPKPGSVTPGYVCRNARPISTLQIHGTHDWEVFYQGLQGTGNPYDAAAGSASLFAQNNGCQKEGAEFFPPGAYSLSRGSAPLSMRLRPRTPADQNDTEVYSVCGCEGGAGVELWKILGASHTPRLTSEYKTSLLDWLQRHGKQASGIPAVTAR